MRINEKPALLLVFFLLAAFLPCYAQEHGNLTGKVVDHKGSVLPGASVMVDGTTLGTATDLNGLFTLRGIPAGERKITVEYLGFKPFSITVNIEKGKTIDQNFKLTETVKNLEGVVVSSVVSGQQRALNQQKTADNIMQVLSADQMDRFPDLNVSEALQRLSGVTITRSRGEGAEVSLRGTPANFVNINVNGEQMMGATDDGKRNAALNVIPADILSSMEVQKTLLPSNDGDAIAGVINMRTGIARSLKSQTVIDVGSGYNVLRERALLNTKLGYSKRFAASEKNKDGRFGVAGNLSYYKTYNGYDRLEAQSWLQRDIVNSAGTPVTKGVYLPTDFRYRYQEGKLSRYGGTLAFDYAPTVNTRFTLSSMYNKREEEDTRYRNRYRYRGAFYDRGGGKIGTDRTQNIVQTTYQHIWTTNYNMNLEGESTIGSWKIDGGVFYSKSRKDAINGQYGFQNPDWRANNSNIAGTDNGTGVPIKIPTRTVLAEMPSYQEKFLTSYYVYTPPYGGAADDPSRFNFYTVDNNDHITNGTNITGRFNASKNYFLSKKYASVFSFGAKGKFMHNEHHRPATATVSSISAGNDTRLANFLKTNNVSDDFMDGHLNFGPAANVDIIQTFIKNNPGRFVLNKYQTSLNADQAYYDANENIAAGYLMNKIQFSKMMMLFGVRMENTHVDYKANKIFSYDSAANPNINGGQKPGTTTPVYNTYKKTPGDSSYNYWMVLPNLQFRFDLAKNTIMRAAWTTGYSRPNFPSIMPTMSVNTDLGKVEKGNPNLKPAYANNLDLLFEHYMKKVGLLSGGVFYKHINRFQYLSEGPITDPSNPYYASGATDQYVIREPRNGKAADVVGIELTYNSTLTFLPGFLKNLVFTSNYTYAHSKAISDQKRGELRLPGQADHTANLALGYVTKKFTIQGSTNYNGKFITALGSNKEEDLWVEARWQLDVNANYKITDRWMIYVEGVNVMNSSTFTYMGNSTRVYELEYDGAFTRIGMNYRF